ncbi:hypothetical protein D6D06_07065 [Aureobasidium pullulans]|nr:hypothetical protein D6D06_07065 [Aureobasidium pullulans]
MESRPPRQLHPRSTLRQRLDLDQRRHMGCHEPELPDQNRNHQRTRTLDRWRSPWVDCWRWMEEFVYACLWVAEVEFARV